PVPGSGDKGARLGGIPAAGAAVGLRARAAHGPSAAPESSRIPRVRPCPSGCRPHDSGRTPATRRSPCRACPAECDPPPAADLGPHRRRHRGHAGRGAVAANPSRVGNAPVGLRRPYRLCRAAGPFPRQAAPPPAGSGAGGSSAARLRRAPHPPGRTGTDPRRRPPRTASGRLPLTASARRRQPPGRWTPANLHAGCYGRRPPRLRSKTRRSASWRTGRGTVSRPTSASRAATPAANSTSDRHWSDEIDRCLTRSR
ncbi:MAG: hypothetical protein QOI99_2212, partial [Actinomycetota bacterium]|nr:hypothetical protein [Actinomycetota bacterium]